MYNITGGTPGVSHTEAGKKGVDSKVYTLEDFVHEAEIDHLNMFMLVDFIKNSKICQKVMYNKTLTFMYWYLLFSIIVFLFRFVVILKNICLQ